MPSRIVHRSARVVGRVFAFLLLVVTFVIALPAAIVLHLDTPAARRTVAFVVNHLTRDVFAGQLRIETIGRLGLGGADGVRLRLFDPTGALVAGVDDLSARIDSVALLRSLREGPLVVLLPRVSVGDAQIDLGRDASGDLRLPRAFAPRANAEAEPSNGRPVVVTAPDVRMHVSTHSAPLGLDLAGDLRGGFGSPSLTGQGVDMHASFAGTLAGAETKADARLEGPRIDARVAVDKERTEAAGPLPELARRERLVVRAEAHGTLPALHLRASATGDTMRTELAVDVAPRSGREGRVATLRAHSRANDLHRVPWVGKTVGGRVEITAGARVLLPEGRIDHANADVDTRELAASPVRVRRAHVLVRANGTLSHPALFATVHAEDVRAKAVDLATVDIRSRVDKTARSVRFRDVSVRAARARGETFGADANLVDLEGSRIAVDRTVLCATSLAGQVRAQGEDLRFTLGTPWQRARGRLRVQGVVDLAKLPAMFPAADLPLTRGRLDLVGSFRHDAKQLAPAIAVHAWSRGLAVDAPARWRSSGIDIGADFRADGASGLTQAAFRAWDAHGPLVAVDAKTILPPADVANRPTRRDLLHAPLSLKATVPRRRFADLPAVLGVRDVPGSLQAELDVTGTPAAPRIALAAEGRGVVVPGGPTTPTDIATTVTYDGRAADAALALVASGRRLLAATSHVDANAHQVAAALKYGRPLDWQGSAHVVADAMPLELVPFLADQRIRGLATGDVLLTGLHRRPTVRGSIDLEDLVIGRAVYPRGTITLNAGPRTVAGSIRLDQTDGLLDVSLESGLTWNRNLVPRLDVARPVNAKLLAVGFRAAALQPFVEGAMPDLDGRIDADISARLSPRDRRPTFAGTAHVHDGRLSIGGNELHAVRGDLTLDPGTIHLANVFARSSQGELRGDALAKLDGARLTAARGRLHVPDHRPFDLAVQGIPIGDVSGTVDAEATFGEETDVRVDIPKLAVVLPRSTRTDIQSLDRNPAIRIGVYHEDGRFVRLPLYEGDLAANENVSPNGKRTVVRIAIRKAAISRGNELRLLVSGNPRVEVSHGETKMLGQLQVDRGWMDVQGKRFDVEKGTVTFDGSSPPDPTVLATAGWTAADGTRVFADFLGRVSTGKLTLRSEPPRPKSEILALVFFGTADGANPAPTQVAGQSSGTTRAAVGLGGAFAAKGLTQALDSLTGVQTVARVDTTQSNNPRPEVEFELSPRITVGFAHVLGTPPITEPDKNLASFEYRFHKNWSLETVFGDRGSALVDTLWQRRY